MYQHIGPVRCGSLVRPLRTSQPSNPSLKPNPSALNGLAEQQTQTYPSSSSLSGVWAAGFPAPFDPSIPFSLSFVRVYGCHISLSSTSPYLEQALVTDGNGAAGLPCVNGHSTSPWKQDLGKENHNRASRCRHGRSALTQGLGSHRASFTRPHRKPSRPRSSSTLSTLEPPSKHHHLGPQRLEAKLQRNYPQSSQTTKPYVSPYPRPQTPANPSPTDARTTMCETLTIAYTCLPPALADPVPARPPPLLRALPPAE